MNIVINCELCHEKSLHINQNHNFDSRQCINCGFTTNDKLKGTKDDNEFFKVLSEFVQKHSAESNGYVWIPSVLTLPIGSLYPIDKDNKLKWAFASLVDVTEEEKESFPVEGQEGKFHTKKLDTDNAKVFEKYLFALAELQQEMSKKTDSIKDNG